MNKVFWVLQTFLMVAMLSVGFVSCGGDDDETYGGNGQVDNHL